MKDFLLSRGFISFSVLVLGIVVGEHAQLSENTVGNLIIFLAALLLVFSLLVPSFYRPTDAIPNVDEAKTRAIDAVYDTADDLFIVGSSLLFALVGLLVFLLFFIDPASTPFATKAFKSFGVGFFSLAVVQMAFLVKSFIGREANRAKEQIIPTPLKHSVYLNPPLAKAVSNTKKPEEPHVVH